MINRAWLLLLLAVPGPAWAGGSRALGEPTIAPVEVRAAQTSAANPTAAVPGLPAALPGLASFAEPAKGEPPSSPALKVVHALAPLRQNVAQLRELSQSAPQSPEAAAPLAAAPFDGLSAPLAPDWQALDTRRREAALPVPSALSPYLPRPLGAWLDRLARRRSERAALSRRLTVEEDGAKESLALIHAELTKGRPQKALDILDAMFSGKTARDWYRGNPLFKGYYDQAMVYYRHCEIMLKGAHGRVQRRGADPVLVAEAEAAPDLIGHAYRRTAIQDCGSPYCVFHAFYNAVSASVGFAAPAGVRGLVDHARARLNEKVTLKGVSETTAARLAREFGLKLHVDVGEGMGIDSMARFAALLGLPMAVRGPPESEAQLVELMASGREILLSLRLFHERYRHSPGEREVFGHDHPVLHHEVYVLGSYVSPSLGRRVYMVQDSGSGATDLYTWSELRALAQEMQVLSPSGPVIIAP